MKVNIIINIFTQNGDEFQLFCVIFIIQVLISLGYWYSFCCLKNIKNINNITKFYMYYFYVKDNFKYFKFLKEGNTADKTERSSI